MKNTLLAWIGAAGLIAWVANAETTIHGFIQGWDGEVYASTFTEHVSRAMDWEWEYRDEVCGATQVSHLPQNIQDAIMAVWGDIEMVRECTAPVEVRHDY